LNQLINDTINSFNEYVKIIPGGTLEISKFLREENLPLALQSIKDFTEGVIWLTDVKEALGKSGVEVELELESIHDFLIEINEGLEIQDFILVADIFEYEIATFFKDVAEIQTVC